MNEPAEMIIVLVLMAAAAICLIVELIGRLF